jgi:hypothetical protein
VGLFQHDQFDAADQIGDQVVEDCAEGHRRRHQHRPHDRGEKDHTEVQLSFGSKDDRQLLEHLRETGGDSPLDGDRPGDPHPEYEDEGGNEVEYETDLEDGPGIDLADDASHASYGHRASFDGRL